MTKDKALRMALEALTATMSTHGFKDAIDEAQDKAITAIKEALAQPEQEPVAYIHRNEYNEYRLEPHDSFDIKSIPFNVDVPLFKAPQRTWVGLTPQERDEINEQVYGAVPHHVAFHHAIEAKLKEKNT